jgi:hypothetical protein
MNLTLPRNPSFYIADITTPFSWYCVEAGRHNTIYFRINGPAFSASKVSLPEGNKSTTTFVNAMCDAMNAHDPLAPRAGTFPTRFEPHANLVHNTITIFNSQNKFEILTDEQALT